MEKRAPRIVRFESHPEWAAVSAEIAQAYDPELGLMRWDRHLLMIRPNLWVVADELEADHEARYDVLYHSWGEEFQTDRPFESAGPAQWETGGTRGRLRVRLLTPEAVEGVAEKQFQEGIGAHRDRWMNLLRFFNPRLVRHLWCVVLLEAFPTGGSPCVRHAGWKEGEVEIVQETRRWTWRPCEGRLV